MYPITLYNSWWKLCPFVIVLSGYCLFKEKLKSGGWLEKAPVSKNGPWPGICLVFICKSGIYTVPERGVMCVRDRKIGHVEEQRKSPCSSSALKHQRWLKKHCWMHKCWAHGHRSSFLHSFCTFILSLTLCFVCLWALGLFLLGQWQRIRIRTLWAPQDFLTLYNKALSLSLLCFSHSDLKRWLISPAN